MDTLNSLAQAQMNTATALIEVIEDHFEYEPECNGLPRDIVHIACLATKALAQYIEGDSLAVTMIDSIFGSDIEPIEIATILRSAIRHLQSQIEQSTEIQYVLPQVLEALPEELVSVD